MAVNYRCNQSRGAITPNHKSWDFIGAIKECEEWWQEDDEARMAGKLADECLSEPLVTGVTVTLKKPGAVRFSKSVGVKIHREK